MSEDYESIVLVKNEVFVYRIPPLQSNRGHKAADWKLDSPDWVGRLRLMSRGKNIVLKLEDKTTGDLFAKCPIDKYPGVAVEPVSDSSRYFVIRLQDDNGRTAFIGIGFADRGDSFDLNVALQDHFKYLEKETKLTQEQAHDSHQPKLDLGFKEGQTITLNIGKKSNGAGTSRPRAAAATGGPVPLLPPPPSSGTRVSPLHNVNHERSSPSTFQSQLNASAKSHNPFVSNDTSAFDAEPIGQAFPTNAFSAAPAQSVPTNPFLSNTSNIMSQNPISTANAEAVGNLL